MYRATLLGLAILLVATASAVVLYYPAANDVAARWFAASGLVDEAAAKEAPPRLSWQGPLGALATWFYQKHGWPGVDTVGLLAAVFAILAAASFGVIRREMGGLGVTTAGVLLVAGIGLLWPGGLAYGPALMVASCLLIILGSSRTEKPIRLGIHFLGGFMAGWLFTPGLAAALIYLIGALALSRTDFDQAPAEQDRIERRPRPFRRPPVSPLLRQWVTSVMVVLGWLASVDAVRLVQGLSGGAPLEQVFGSFLPGLGGLAWFWVLLALLPSLASGAMFRVQGLRSRLTALVLLPLLAFLFPALAWCSALVGAAISAERLARSPERSWTRSPVCVFAVVFLLTTLAVNRLGEGWGRQLAGWAKDPLPAELVLLAKEKPLAVGAGVAPLDALAGLNPVTRLTLSQMSEAAKLRAAEREHGFQRLFVRSTGRLEANAFQEARVKAAWGLLAITPEGALLGLGEADRAETDLDVASYNPTSIGLIARELIHLHRHREARSLLDAAEQAGKYSEEMALARSALFGSQDQFDLMLETSLRAIERGINSAPLLHMGTLAAVRRGDKKAARRLGDALAAHREAGFKDFIMAAQAARLNDDAVSELEYLLRARKTNGREGKHARFRLVVGQAYQKAGRYREAIREYELALKSGELSQQEVIEAEDRLRTLRGDLPPR